MEIILNKKKTVKENIETGDFVFIDRKKGLGEEIFQVVDLVHESVQILVNVNTSLKEFERIAQHNISKSLNDWIEGIIKKNGFEEDYKVIKKDKAKLIIEL